MTFHLWLPASLAQISSKLPWGRKFLNSVLLLPFLPSQISSLHPAPPVLPPLCLQAFLLANLHSSNSIWHLHLGSWIQNDPSKARFQSSHAIYFCRKRGSHSFLAHHHPPYLSSVAHLGSLGFLNPFLHSHCMEAMPVTDQAGKESLLLFGGEGGGGEDCKYS